MKLDNNDTPKTSPDAPTKDMMLYEKGNAYRKQGQWDEAINCYLEAMEINPESPAATAYEMLMNILNFYNKDAYNP
jgi:tetratricopeptide (TPR) repeat protein